MAVRQILLWPDARLQTRCASVGEVTAEVRSLAADMLETMYAAPGRGLAGPQIGVMQRIFVMDATWKEGARTPFVAIDPEIIGASAESCEMDEGCLSIPGITAQVRRPERITLRWRDLDGETHERDMTGAEARIAQHEFDHLEGIVHFDRVDAETRAVLMEAYA